MAKATDKATLITTLVIGQVEVPVAMFSATVDKPAKLADFDTGGPNGGRLMARSVAKPTPVEQVPVDEEPVGVVGEPLGPGPGAERDTFEADGMIAPASWPPEPLTGEQVLDTVAAPPLEPAILDFREQNPHDDAAAGGYARANVTWTHELDVGPADVTFNSVPGEYGTELVEEGSGVVVKPQDVRRGVRLEDGRFIDCTRQLAEIEGRTKLDTMTVIGFVDTSQIPRAWARGAKYLGAGDESAPHALRIVFEGLKATRRAAIVKLTKRTRQTLGAIVATRGVLMLFELVWREDFREPPARARAIQGAAVHSAEVGMFAQLVHAMAIPASALDELRDDAIRLREELKTRALEGEVPDVLEAQGSPAPDVAEMLEASLAAYRERPSGPEVLPAGREA